MAKIVFPLQSYQEKLLEELLQLFPISQSLFIAGVATGVNGKSVSRVGLKEKISGKQNSSEEEDQSKVIDQFKKDVLRLKLPFDIYYSGSSDSKSLLEDKSRFANLILFSENNELREINLDNLKKYNFSSPVLLPSKQILHTKEILVPLLDNSCLGLLKEFLSTIPHFLKSRKVIIMAPKPENDKEIQEEKFLIEFLRANLSIVSFCWFNPGKAIEDTAQQLSALENPSMIVIPKNRINDFKEYLNRDTVSIFTRN